MEFLDNSFSNFLKTTIVMTKNDYSAQNFGFRIHLTHNDGNIVSFSSCMFNNCSSDSDEGGALYLWEDNYPIDLFITRSSFFMCHTPYSRGGAIFFQSQSCYLKQTCFSKCYAPDSTGQAIDIVTHNDKVININGCSFFLSAPSLSELDESKSPIYLYQGEQSILQTNVSKNRVGDVFSGIYTDDSISLILSFVTFLENYGNIVLGIEDIRNNDDISYINFIKNICPNHDYGLVYVTEATTRICRSSFISNTDILLHSNGYLNVIFDECIFNTPISALNYSSLISVTTPGCQIDQSDRSYHLSVFDTRYCWMINPPTLNAGSITNWFFLLFFAFTISIIYFTWKKNPDFFSLTSKSNPAYDEIQ